MLQHSSGSRQACTVASQNGGLDPTAGHVPSGLCPGETPGDGLYLEMSKVLLALGASAVCKSRKAKVFTHTLLW